MDSTIVISAYVVWQLVQNWAIGGELLDEVTQIAALAVGPEREPALIFAREDMAELREHLHGLLSEEGIPLDPTQRILWESRFFEGAGSAQYYGVDSNIPSQYLERFREFLGHHARHLRRSEPGARILLATPEKINHDRVHNPAGFEQFIAWHEEHKRSGSSVELLWAHPDSAARLSEDYRLRSTDVAIWQGRYAVLFSESDASEIRLSIAFSDGDLYSRCREYLEMVWNLASPIPTLSEPALPNIGPLADVWEEYVLPAKRLEKLGPFLLHVLEPFKEGGGVVLDAATGIGCESTFLLDKDFSIVSNEVDVLLQAKASEYASRSKRQLSLQAIDWLQLEALPGNLRFDAILVLGNSLCLVDPTCPIYPRGDRGICLENFYRILKPGGRLIVDERNFPLMLRERDSIMSNPVTNYPWSGEVMYCGRKYQGRPIEISEEQVTWRIYLNEPEVRDRAGIDAQRVAPDLTIYPFRPGELPRLLFEVGFDRVGVYVDLEKLDDFTDPVQLDARLTEVLSTGTVEQTEFFTYVAEKTDP